MDAWLPNALAFGIFVWMHPWTFGGKADILLLCQTYFQIRRYADAAVETVSADRGRGDEMGRPGVMFYFDVRPCIKRLSESEKGRLFEAILDYAQYGVIPEMEGMLGVAWDFIQPKIDRDNEKYEMVVEQRKTAGRKGGRPRGPQLQHTEANASCEKQMKANAFFAKQTKPTTTTASTTATATTTPLTPDTETNESRVGDKPPVRPGFSPPDLEEIRLFCQENGYQMSPEAFVDYYAANGWMVGRNRMKDWKAAVRRWERKEAPHGTLEAKPSWQVGNVL